jgi:hypothetical protein
MTGFNLPPGVTEGMIPGNRPEDIEFEKFADWAIDEFAMSDIPIQDLYFIVKLSIQNYKETKWNKNSS